MHEHLLPPLPPSAVEGLEALGRALDRTHPVRAKHRKDLPYAVADLSRALTCERDTLRKDYMGNKRSLSAYLRYFLPWNVYRLSRLFSGLGFDLPDDAVLADLGSGPLTAPIALWLARPDLRQRRLTLKCVDRSPTAMKSGLALFDHLAGRDIPWKVELVKGAFGANLRGKVDLLLAANVLNEVLRPGRGLEERAWRLARDVRGQLSDAGRLLVVEPGVRRGGPTLAAVRAALMEEDMAPLAPCPHTGDCPMHGTGRAPWCHFTFDTRGAPEWLHALSAAAKLDKQRAALSFLFFGPADDPAAATDAQDACPVRAVSDGFPLGRGTGQYGCSAKGLTVLHYPQGAAPARSGELVRAPWPETPATDDKSGGLILPVDPPTPRTGKGQGRDRRGRR